MPPEVVPADSDGAIVEEGSPPHHVRRRHQCGLGWVGSEWFEVTIGTDDPVPTYDLVRGTMCSHEVHGQDTCVFEWCEDPPPCDLEPRPPAGARDE